MAIGYAITYQYFTSVNYLCLPLGLNTAGALAVFMDTITWFTYIQPGYIKEQSVSSWKMFNSS